MHPRHRRPGARTAHFRRHEHLSLTGSFASSPPSRPTRRNNLIMSEAEPGFGQADIVRLSDEDAAVALLERAVTGLWEVVNDLTRFRRTSRQNYRVTIFGSARIKPGAPVYADVKKLAAELSRLGCYILTGGGPGLMQAANEG